MIFAILAAITLDGGFPVTQTPTYNGGTTTLVGPSFTTAGASTVVAVAAFACNGTCTVGTTSGSGAGLTWTKMVEQFSTNVAETAGVSIWAAASSGTLTAQTFTLTMNSIAREGGVVMYSFGGAQAAAGTTATVASGGTGVNITVTLTPANAGSTIVGAWCERQGANTAALANTTFDFDGSGATIGTHTLQWHLTSNNTTTSSTTTGTQETNTAAGSGAAAFELLAAGGGGGAALPAVKQRALMGVGR